MNEVYSFITIIPEEEKNVHVKMLYGLERF